MNAKSPMIGHRVLVDGMMGSGKSTFARALAQETGLPLIHLDVHYWNPGWTRPSDDEWRERQRALLAGEAWIIDGNYNETLALRLERADTIIFLDTPWWLCAEPRVCPRTSQAQWRDARGLRGLAQPPPARRVGRHRPDLAQPTFRPCVRTRRDQADTGRTPQLTCSARAKRRRRFSTPSAAGTPRQRTDAPQSSLSVAPSIRSRIRSAWPLCREYSSIMWLRIHRIDTSRPDR